MFPAGIRNHRFQPDTKEHWKLVPSSDEVRAMAEVYWDAKIWRLLRCDRDEAPAGKTRGGVREELLAAVDHFTEVYFD